MKAFHQGTRAFGVEDADRRWFVVDAEGKTLGRLATRVATVLRGKHKPQFTTHTDTGDFVIVLNASKIRLTGKRPALKRYYHNTMYPGGARFESVTALLARHPEAVISRAVRGMLPKTSLGTRQFKKLKVYAGAEHPHAAQHPQPLAF